MRTSLPAPKKFEYGGVGSFRSPSCLPLLCKRFNGLNLRAPTEPPVHSRPDPYPNRYQCSRT
eukprot:5118364-Amphidinium_carterae.1